MERESVSKTRPEELLVWDIQVETLSRQVDKSGLRKVAWMQNMNLGVTAHGWHDGSFYMSPWLYPMDPGISSNTHKLLL